MELDTTHLGDGIYAAVYGSAVVIAEGDTLVVLTEDAAWELLRFLLRSLAPLTYGTRIDENHEKTRSAVGSTEGG